MKKSKKNANPIFLRIAFGLFFLIVAIIYFHNVTRDIYSGDIGDLVTASYVMGVAHPPGYPLFTMLGFLFTHLPFAVPVVTKVAYVSTLFSLIGLGIFSYFSYRTTKHVYLSLLTTAVLAFSYFYWIYAEIPEVFGLNNFFVILILVLALLFYQTKKLHFLYLLGFVTGLSLTHHHTILFVLPAALLLVLRHFKLLISHWSIIPLGILSFLSGLIPYLYVPFAASQDPIVNWDNVNSWERFVHLVMRKDYGFAPTLQGTTPLPIKFILVRDYLMTLADNYSYQIVFVALLGIVKLIRLDKWLAFCLLFAFVLSGPFFIFYAAPPIATTAGWGIIERMYTFSSVTFIFFVPFGFLLIKDFFAKRFPKKVYGTAVLLYFLIIPLFMVYYNFPKADLSKTTIGNNLALDIVTPLPKNALLFMEGDTTTFNLWYVHHVLKTRQDIGIINPPGVGGWNYLDERVNEYKKSHPTVQNQNILYLTLEELRKTRPIYGTQKFGHQPKDTLLIPWGMTYQLINQEDIPTKEVYIDKVEDKLQTMHIVRRETLQLRDSNMITSEIPLIYSNALVRIGDFMTLQYKDYAKSEHYYRRALWIDNENPAAYAGLGLSQYKAYKDCTNAIANMKNAIDQYRVWKAYYFQLFLLYKACNTDTKTVNEFKMQYNMEMNSNFDKDLKAAQISI